MSRNILQRVCEVGIDAADQLMMSRYILQRVCEDFQISLLHSASQAHCRGRLEWRWHAPNVSTKSMRDDGGLEVIKAAIYKLGAKDAEHN
jgi:glutamine synthetase